MKERFEGSMSNLENTKKCQPIKLRDIHSLESYLVFVSKILHTSYIEVNEEGTEAAAATFDVRPPGCSQNLPPPPASFVADHPFIFMIREEIYGIMFFTGVVLNPLFWLIDICLCEGA